MNFKISPTLMKSKLTLLFSILLISSCANPINRVTYNNYIKKANNSQRQGNLEAAEEALYRALVNARIGNLGPEVESTALYDLAGVKRQLKKLQEAHELIAMSLEIEEKVSGKNSKFVADRLIRKASIYAMQKEYEKGLEVVDLFLPIMFKYPKQSDWKWVPNLLDEYALELKKTGNVAESKKVQNKTNELRDYYGIQKSS